MTPPTITLSVGETALTLTERGTGRAVLLLHGGGGPASLSRLAHALSSQAHVQVPTHPGFGATPRPPHLDSIPRLAALYAELLTQRDLRDVVVIGFSMGGWIAAELALGTAAGRVGALVLVGAIGVDVPGEPVVDVLPLSPHALAELSFADPGAYVVDPALLPSAYRVMAQANASALAAYIASGLTDPGLATRLGSLQVPSLVVWGDQDRIVSPTFGRAYAAALPGARFELLAHCGHMPQIEQPARLLALIETFMEATQETRIAGHRPPSFNEVSN